MAINKIVGVNRLFRLFFMGGAKAKNVEAACRIRASAICFV